MKSEDKNLESGEKGFLTKVLTSGLCGIGMVLLFWFVTIVLYVPFKDAFNYKGEANDLVVTQLSTIRLIILSSWYFFSVQVWVFSTLFFYDRLYRVNKTK